MSEERDVLVLGAGPAGVGAALCLAERGLDVEVIERQSVVGGNAGSFELAGVKVDFGSHRLHPASDPLVLERIRALLGDDLLERPRHGRIRLRGRWIHFPLRPLDLALNAHPLFVLGTGIDLIKKMLPGRAPTDRETFASVLDRGLGTTICQQFYFPYARKMWGLEPEEISPIQAQRRISAGSLGKLIRRLIPGQGQGGASRKGVFYYPRRGFGQISDRFGEAAIEAGARIAFDSTVARVTQNGAGFEVRVTSEAGPRTLRAPHVWSTIPSPVLVRLFDPEAPSEVLEAAGRLELRAMLLVYLVLDSDRYTEFDAHYFPETAIPFTRLSEPKNYSALGEPDRRTVLCAEIPCSVGDEIWSSEDGALGELVATGLVTAGLPAVEPIEVHSRRLPAAYPIYRRGYEQHFAKLDGWLDDIPNLLSFGRQGLFAHDNTHHALFMAFAANDCLRDDGSLDERAWQDYRRVFETHVVED